MGGDSSVGIATRYELDGLGIEFRWGARFSAHVQTGPRAQPASYTMGTWYRGTALTTHPHPAPRLRKESSYTSAPPLGLRGLLQGELYLYLHL